MSARPVRRRTAVDHPDRRPVNASDRADVQHDAGATYRSTRLRLTALLNGLSDDVSAPTAGAEGPGRLFVFGPRTSALCE